MPERDKRKKLAGVLNSLPFLSGRFGKVVFGLAIALLLILAFAADRATIR